MDFSNLFNKDYFLNYASTTAYHSHEPTKVPTQTPTQAPTQAPTKAVVQPAAQDPNLIQNLNTLGKDLKDTGTTIYKSTNKSFNTVNNYISNLITTKVLCYLIFHFIMLISALILFFRCKNQIKENVLQFICALVVPYFYVIGSIVSNSGICNV